MKSKILGRILTAALLAGAGIAGAADKGNATGPQSDAQIAAHVRHEVLMYPYYSLWDDINFRIANGQVELFGAVSQPFKKSDVERLVQKVPGVTSVTDQIKVLPTSFEDDRLRIQVARAIFREPALSRYAMGPVPSIHIIVDSGHVTLTGVVNNQMEKQIAGMRASGAGLGFGPVINNLQVEHPAPKKG